MPTFTYAAHALGEWLDFTSQHTRTREMAETIASGQHPIAAGAIVGVYGSGKSTLLFHVLDRAAEEGVFPIWEEAYSFLNRLVNPSECVAPQEFVTRVHDWVEELRHGGNALAQYKHDLAHRQLGAIAERVEAAAHKSTSRCVLLLDEMEQAYPQFLKRIDTADQQPLRALIDSCGNSRLRLLMAYAPESFYSIGDADRGRMLRLTVPGLDATAIQKTFQLSKGQANFAWWASRGRARGVIRVIDEIIGPFQRGEFRENWRSLADALDGLLPVFGVPAILRAMIPTERLVELLDLVPGEEEIGTPGEFIDTRDQPRLARPLTEVLAAQRARIEDVEVIVDELLGVLVAVSDAEYRCFLNFDDFAAAVRLAVGRAVESGRLREAIETLDYGRAFYKVTTHTNSRRALPFSVHRLADEIFPSPFTDPVLPLLDGRLPTQAEVDGLFGRLVFNGPVLRWEEHGCLVFSDPSVLEHWLASELLNQDESKVWRALLLQESGAPSRLVSLAQESGRISCKTLPRFHGCFLKCLALRKDQSEPDVDIEQLAAAARGSDRQLGRKVDWHLARLERLVEENQPIPQRRWQAAVGAARGESLSVALGRLREESPGLLAFLYPFKTPRPETRRVLADLAELLGETSDLRKLAKAAGQGKQLEGAAVVVDELLPAGNSQTSKPRWIDVNFPGRDELRAVLEMFASPELASVLGKLLNPHAAARMERVVRLFTGELPDLKPERQQLSALQGLAGVMQRTRAVYNGIRVLIGSQEDVRGLAVGKVISQAFAAQKSIEDFNGIGSRIDKIDEPWAKSLACWVAAVFAERIWDGVERDEASLKAWEKLAERGKEVRGSIEERLQALKEAGLRATADFLAMERHRLRAAVSDLDQMEVRLPELENTTEQLLGIVEAVTAFSALAQAKGIDVSRMFDSFHPEPGRILEDRAFIERTVDLIRQIQDDWPLPLSEDLREYLRNLQRFAEESHAERIRGRLSQITGVSIPAKSIVLDGDDLTLIEDAWPHVAEDFTSAWREAVEVTPPPGSDKLVVWLKEALGKQEIMASWARLDDVRLESLDVQIRAWITRVAIRPSQLAELHTCRGRALEILTNLSHAVGRSVIDELIDFAIAKPASDAYAVLEREARTFRDSVEETAAALSAIAGRGAVRRPFGGVTREAVLNKLQDSRLAYEKKRSDLHANIETRNRILEELGSRPRPIPSPWTVADAQRLFDAVGQDIKKVASSERKRLANQLGKIGLPESLLDVPKDLTYEELASAVMEARPWVANVELEVQALETMGLSAPTFERVKNRQDTLALLRDAVQSASDHLREANERVSTLRRRLERLGHPSDGYGARIPTSLAKARVELSRLKDEIRAARAKRLEEASEAAQRAYRTLVGDEPDVLGDVSSSIQELVRLGLLRTIEDA